MTEPPDVDALALGDISKQRAYWADAVTLAMRVRKVEGNRYSLHSCTGRRRLSSPPTEWSEGTTSSLTLDPAGLPEAVTAEFPHLKGYAALVIPEEDRGRVPALLKGQLAVSVTDAEGKLVDATGVQIPGVLDDLFAYDGPLGVTWDGRSAHVSVWAPTAQSVWLHLFDRSDATSSPRRSFR